jgi:integrase
MTRIRQRFRIKPFTNWGGSRAWRIEGTKRDGTRIRENHSDLRDAQLRQVALEGEFLARQTDMTLRSTRLTDAQIHFAEIAFARLSDDMELPRAVDHWLRHGKQNTVADSPRVDEAVEQFKKWLDGAPSENGNGSCTLRTLTRSGLRIRVNVFSNSIKNLRVNEITPDIIEDFLTKLKVSNVTRDNYRRAVSRFFTWCIQRPRRWAVVNPCREIRIEKGERPPPAILTVKESKDLLAASEPKGLTPYVAVCLFGGLRPFEALRLTWQAVNLVDKEIRLEANQTKTGRPRVVSICATLLEWLKAYEGQDFFPSNWRKSFDEVKAAAGLGTPDVAHPNLKPWPVDVLRHTAVSHYFRKTGSYGQTAEQFGNSEAIIKAHYQGRVSSEDTRAFYALRPEKNQLNENEKQTCIEENQTNGERCRSRSFGVAVAGRRP